ncbi:C45 family autoproteolytic acyltransferase/hydolase [Taklimakanibacter lacteus]|uniref:C45 family autoproteolytic acyltransferase/hydolase n=1 Tax=Taklimakanibacter lacteus TaxID=2268456 RepID=UPI000E6657E0
MNIVFEAIAEDRPGPKWRAIYDRHWHAYSRWFMRDGMKARPTYLASLRAIRRHMPELVPAYEAVAEAAGGGDLEARFLAMWCPPMYVGGCSQAILTGAEPAIIRNYDYSPKLLEGTWLASRLAGKRVIAMVDCLWGVLDGINEDGLAASLAFGGRTAVADGFGIPIVMRYLLEFASTVAEAVTILRRVPVHMSYTVSLLDRAGHHATVFVAPDRPTEIVDRRIATNHQHEVEWPRHATATRSLERAESLDQSLADNPDTETMLKAFLRPPAYQTSYGRGYGTLYTAIYRPEDRSAELIWPAARWRQSCASFAEGARTILFAEGNAPPRVRPAKGVAIRGGIL